MNPADPEADAGWAQPVGERQRLDVACPRDGDRRGYVIATGETNVQALERAEAAARLVDVEVW